MTVFFVGVLGLHFTMTEESYGTWTPPEFIGGGGGAGPNYQQIACDPSGNVFAVWRQSDGPYLSIYANRYVPGSGWGTAQLIEYASEHASDPEIACDPSGNAFVVWYQGVWGARSIYANQYVPGSGWGTAQLIESASGDATCPEIACDGLGNAVSVWGAAGSIYANRYLPGSGWGTPQCIEFGSETAGYPQIACDHSGNAIVVWYTSNMVPSNVYANRYVPGSGWGTEVEIDSGTAPWAGIPEVACDPQGNAFAVWYEEYTHRVYANRYVPGSGWGTAQRIDSFPSSGYLPQIACDSQGNAMAVWEQWEYPSAYINSICANYYIRGVGWGTSQLVESGTTDAYYPHVAFDSNGNVWAVWEQGIDIRANRFVPGSGWETEELVGVGGYPKIACDNQGNAFVVWPSYDGMYASRTQVQSALVVEIDIKPGSYPNSLNMDGHGVIPVAILGSAEFEVTEIDVSTLSFAGLAVRIKGQGQPQCSVEDVSGDFTGGPEGAPDGYPDLVCQFVDNTDNWSPGNSEATITGNLLDGTPFVGSDEINIVPPAQ